MEFSYKNLKRSRAFCYFCEIHYICIQSSEYLKGLKSQGLEVDLLIFRTNCRTDSSMKRNIFSYIIMSVLTLSVSAQTIRPGYVDWGIKGPEFPAALQKWEKGQKWTEDDNFFISRVRPKSRFRNTATQINPSLDDTNDKKLIFWVPINNQEFNALPDGVFDSEVFPLWSYVTHYGNWSTPLVRIPAGFSDVAHKNGVAVSSVAAIPFGEITDTWRVALEELAKVTPEKLSDYLLYYGVDGIGYNSEFQGDASLVTNLIPLHQNTVKLMKSHGNPVTEFIWYDGTDKNGKIHFDAGLDTHNSSIWGLGDYVRTSLFFNYNWNIKRTLMMSAENAKKWGRNPLDLYCGINMQGREPAYYPEIWPLLAQHPLSIGLWGAHSQNMFFEGRAEQNSTALGNQRTYLNRVIRWFTGSTQNPVNTPELSNSLIHGSETADFFGMSKMMSARSALKWNLSEEPFITYFNLGNGKFFNYRGERQHNSEWYNIGMQDYLPTWMWWFSGKFMGREASDVATDGLKGEFVWDDAYMGGSTIRIYGSSEEEYLHLFKTEFELKDGDVITFRYKLLNGSTDAGIVVSLKGKETVAEGENSMRVMHAGAPIPGIWTEKRFTVGKDLILPAGKEIAMIALHFSNADDLDMRLGEFSIVREESMKSTVATPVVEKSEILTSRNGAADGKIIFNMPHDKGNDVCYNIDVNTSLFKLYAQQEGREPVLMGMTPSWAGLMFSIPCDNNASSRVRLGVSAMNLDWSSESEIAWGEYSDIISKYEISDDIELSKSVIHPGESFTISYSDPKHESGKWKIIDKDGNLIKEVKDDTSIAIEKGILTPGMYTLILEGMEHPAPGIFKLTERTLSGYVQILEEEVGGVPEILEVGYDLSNDQALSEIESECFGFKGDKAYLSYKAAKGEGTTSRGLHIADKGVGFSWDESGIEPGKSFSVSFWYKPEPFKGNRVHLLNIRDKSDAWPINNWGWFWHTVKEDGTTDEFTLRGKDGNNLSYKFADMRLIPGAWYHLAYVFESDTEGRILPSLFINGEEQMVASRTVGEEEFEGAPETGVKPYDWREKNIVAFGGYLHKHGSVGGNIDNLMVWEKSLDSESVKSAMGDIKESSVPEGLKAFFDFENDADNEGRFSSVVPAAIKVGMPTYEATEVEGQSTLRWEKPDYCSGSPFVSGKGMKIKTETIWTAPGAKKLYSSETEDGGTVALQFAYTPLSEEAGTLYPVRLTLSNEFGEDSYDIELSLGFSGVEKVKVEETGITISSTIFDNMLSVKGDKSGEYRLSLLSPDGRTLLINDFLTAGGEEMIIYPDVEKGMYILNVTFKGKQLISKRVIRK